MADIKPPGSEPDPKPEAGNNMKNRLLGNDEDRIDISLLPEMSVEDVDAFLAEEAPDFIKEVSNIAADKSLTLQQIIIDDAEAALNAEVDLWRNYKGPLKILFVIVPAMPKLTLRLKILKFKIAGWVLGQWIRTKNFAIFLLTDGRVTATETVKSAIVLSRKNISESITVFKKISFKVRLVLLLSLLLIVSSVGVVYLSMTKGLLPAEKEIFLTGFINHAAAKFEYDEKQVEPYLENARAVQNLFLTKKFFINLKPSPGSGRNPMGAFEFFIEGMSSDVVIEVKDREPQLRDMMQRVMEDMTYDELDTDDGKRLMCARLQKEISSVLTTGSVKNVRIKSFVIKP